MSVCAIVVGSLVEDLAFRVPSRPEPGEVVIADSFGAFRGGKGYNQAVALARLGAEVVMVGAVGADAYGDGFIAALGRERVNADRVVQLRGTSTAIAVPLITPDGDVGFVQYQGANRQLAPAHCADLPDCDVLLLQGEVPAATSQQAARVIGGRGKAVLLNPAPVHDITPQLLDAATVVVPNEIETRSLVDDLEPPIGAAAAEALRAEGRSAVVTLGARGAAWADADGSGLVEPPSIRAADTTGAGDAFCAALAVALAEGKAMPEAVGFACAAGAHAATVSGAEPGLPTLAQVMALAVAG
ncbi:ribokinase [soil metagenome]